MKKMLLLTCLLMLSATAQAKNVRCEISALQAAERGIKPKESTFQIATESKDSLNCGLMNEMGHSFELCVHESSFVGGYSVSVAIDLLTGEKKSAAEDYGEEAFIDASLFTLKKSGDITIFDQKALYKRSVLAKLDNANLAYDFAQGEDGELMNSTVAKAVKKGILKKGDILSFSIIDCEEIK